jgi:hypothetical protein
MQGITRSKNVQRRVLDRRTARSLLLGLLLAGLLPACCGCLGPRQRQPTTAEAAAGPSAATELPPFSSHSLAPPTLPLGDLGELGQGLDCT